MGKLRTGYTTGACAAAASAGAARMLARQRTAGQVTLRLPGGISARFGLHDATFDAERASCCVIKDAGDDPDVTHGAEIYSEVAWNTAAGPGAVILRAGEGIGTITKPGLAVPPGQPAINPVPRDMITRAVRTELAKAGRDSGVSVTLTIPDGRSRAARTLNQRLGIIGGLSILGTTGIVQPVSHQAWRDTILAALDVALATGVSQVVLAGGRTSERAAQQCMQLPEEAFILVGDHVGFALRACRNKGVATVTLSLQFAKLVKVAAGHDNTHARAARLDLGDLAQWAVQGGLDASAVRQIKLAHTAREAILTQTDPQPLLRLVAERTRALLSARYPGPGVRLLLVDYSGKPWLQVGDHQDPEREGTP